MTVKELKNVLKKAGDGSLSLVLPDEALVPEHFHITEVGHLKKTFIDCGGEVRIDEKCLLQVWVADDMDHRVSAEKLHGILEHGAPVLPSDDLEVEIEYEHPHVSQFALSAVIPACCGGVTLQFTAKHTDCLAKDVCGIAEPEDDSGCCSGTGCC